MAAQADRQLAQLTALIDQRLAAARSDLDHRLNTADRMNRRMSLLHAELSASIEEFSATMTESVRSMTALSDDTLAELERRLAEQGRGVGDSLAELHARADALGLGLDEVGQELTALEGRLPELRADVEHIGTDVQRMGTDAGQAARAIDDLKARTPELDAWLAGQRQELEQALEGGRDQVSAIKVQARAFESEVEQSRERLQTLNVSLDQGLQQAKQDGTALGTAVQGLRDVGAQAAQLMAGAEAEVAAAEQAMRQKIDQMLTDLAGQADLAVLRGEDAARRAQVEIDRRVVSESEKALEALAQAREQQLAVLAERGSAAQHELEQTRAGLLAGWHRMDQTLGERQDQVLAGLDRYASTIETRVEEFLNALDVMLVRNGG
jgi:chromosome segregation ATPase